MNTLLGFENNNMSLHSPTRHLNPSSSSVSLDEVSSLLSMEEESEHANMPPGNSSNELDEIANTSAAQHFATNQASWARNTSTSQSINNTHRGLQSNAPRGPPAGHADLNSAYVQHHHHSHHRSPKFLRYIIPAPIYKRLSSFPYLFTIYILSLVFLITLIFSSYHSYSNDLGSEWNDACRPLTEYYHLASHAATQDSAHKTAELHTRELSTASHSSTDAKIPSNTSLSFGMFIESYDMRMRFDVRHTSNEASSSHEKHSSSAHTLEQSSTTALPTFSPNLAYELLITFKIQADFSTECLILHAEDIKLDTTNEEGSLLWRHFKDKDGNDISIGEESTDPASFDHSRKGRSFSASIFPYSPYGDTPDEEESYKAQFRKANFEYIKSVNVDDVDGSGNQLKNPIPTEGDPIYGTKISSPERGIVIHFNERLYAGVYQLLLKVSDVSPDPWLRSYFVSSYKSSSSEGAAPQIQHHNIALSHYFPTFARRVFPSLDDPNFRAVHQLELWIQDGGETITSPVRRQESRSFVSGDYSVRNGMETVKKSYHFSALSNMEKEVDQYLLFPNDPQLSSRIIRFKPTPELATYMTGWVLGHFDSIWTQKQGVDFTLYAPKGYSQYGRYALNEAANATTYFSHFLEYAYPNLKLDLVALPAFPLQSNGVLGLVYLQQDYSLGDPSRMSLDQQMEITLSVTRGIAEQWSANLVTTRKWSNLFAIQGFSLFLSHMAIDFMHPEWKIWEQFLVTHKQSFMMLDSLPRTYSLAETPFASSFDGSPFDNVPPIKGEMLLYALYRYMGKSNFQSWLSQFYRNNYYKSIDYLDVVHSLPTEDIRQKIFNWFTLSGYPAVEIVPEYHASTIDDEEHQKNVGTDSSYYLQQSKFATFNLSNEDTSASGWWIPIQLVTSSGQVVELQLESNQLISQVESSLFNTDWYLFRSDFPCRFKYPPIMWKRLSNMIRGQHPWITKVDRYHLIDDIFAFSKYDDLPLLYTQNMLRAVAKSENSLLVWRTVINQLRSLSRLTNQLPVHTYFSKFCCSILKRIVSEFGWNSTPESGIKDLTEALQRKHLRAVVLDAASYFGDEEVMSEGLLLYKQYMQSNNSDFRDNFDTSLFPVLLQNAVRHGGEAEFFDLHKVASEFSFEYQRHAAYAVAQTRIPALIRTALDFTISASTHQEHGIFIMRQIAENPYGISLAWDFFRNYQTKIITKFGVAETSALLPFFAESFSTHLHYREMLSLRGSLSSRQLDIALQIIQKNQVFMEKKYEEFNSLMRLSTSHTDAN